jgi:hypothetical protein
MKMSENHKQFGSYIETVMDAIESIAAEEDPTGRGFTRGQVERGLREVLGNADHVFWAAEEAFLAGHEAAMTKTVPALFQDPTHVPNLICLWAQYTPSDAVIDRVQGDA